MADPDGIERGDAKRADIRFRGRLTAPRIRSPPMDHALPLSSHRRYPLLLGAVNLDGKPVSTRFFDEAPDARILVRNGFMEVRSVGPVEGRGTSGFYWGAALPSRGHQDAWKAISEDLGAAGMFREGRRWVLFTDSLGINSLYLREYEGYLFFSNRMSPLVAVPGSLNVDWSAWASIFVLGGPLGETTPFLEIRRLEGASGLALEKGKLSRLSYMPGWLAGDGLATDTGALVDAVRGALPARSVLPQSPGIPLSGGWDSRLLAGLATESYSGRLRAWTSASDDGFDLDVPYASAVARTLRLRHTTFSQPDSGWPDLATETRVRAQFETWLHTWLTPLFRRIRHDEASVLDGLAGDVLIKGLFVTERLLDLPPEQRLERLFRRLGYQPDDRFMTGLRPRAGNGIVETAQQSFLSVAARYSDHLNHLALTVLHTRTTRVVGIAPTTLLAPEVKTWFPFLDPDVLRISLNIGPNLKTGGALYRDVLRRGVPRVADLPSTNDPTPPKRTPAGHRLQASTEATDWMIDSVLASPIVVDLLVPEVAEDLRQKGPTWERPSPQMERLLLAGSLLAQWERFYRGRITLASPPW